VIPIANVQFHPISKYKFQAVVKDGEKIHTFVFGETSREHALNIIPALISREREGSKTRRKNGGGA
jgi:hypothetical protein